MRKIFLACVMSLSLLVCNGCVMLLIPAALGAGAGAGVLGHEVLERVTETPQAEVSDAPRP